MLSISSNINQAYRSGDNSNAAQQYQTV